MINPNLKREPQALNWRNVHNSLDHPSHLLKDKQTDADKHPHKADLGFFLSHDNIVRKWPFPWVWKTFPMGMENLSHGNVKYLTNYAWEWSLFDNLSVGNCSIWQLTHGNGKGKSSKITKFLSRVRPQKVFKKFCTFYTQRFESPKTRLPISLLLKKERSRPGDHKQEKSHV